MSTIELRQQAKSIIDGMSPKDLRLVRDFLSFVTARDTNAATRELLGIPGFQKSFLRGVKDIKSSRVKPWRTMSKPTITTRNSDGLPIITSPPGTAAITSAAVARGV
jgi:hypothetical protein